MVEDESYHIPNTAALQTHLRVYNLQTTEIMKGTPDYEVKWFFLNVIVNPLFESEVMLSCLKIHIFCYILNFQSI